MTVAFIGLGIMGMPMARNLLAAGHAVTAYNRTRARTDEFVRSGGTGAASIAAAVADADVVFTMLPDSPDVEDVVLGPDGVFASARRGALWIDTSTIRPATSRHLADVARNAGLSPLDAPVSGGERGAIDATLSIMVGGDQADVDRARETLSALGTTLRHVGASGSGQLVKAANQLIVAANIEAVAEALVLLEAHQVDTTAALAVLNAGLAGSAVLTQKGPKMLDRDFQPGFRLELHDKDLRIVMAAAAEAGVTLPLGSVVAHLVAELVNAGDGGLDHSVLYSRVARLANDN